LAEVRAHIAKAARVTGRAPEEITLVAVSKRVDAARVGEALAAGQAVFGENYGQELRDKARAVSGARWHFIGPLQRNKVKYVVGTAELIHSVDSGALGQAIAERARALGIRQRCLVQVNVGDEAQKAGCHPDALPALLDELRRSETLAIEGLMCIPPAEGDPRQHFARLAALGRRAGLSALSMGMSGDYEAAIAEGATLVRVGTAIFGPR
jgi:pyridoxal phosphate enzyme (YggS family)